MCSNILTGADTKNAKEMKNVDKVRWPLAYCLQPPKPKQASLQAFGFESDRPSPRRWWSYRLYRGPGNKEVEILYSRTKARSEIIAQRFLNEPVLGFDMEWPWNDWKRNDLQNKIGLIQIASEDKIGLFHIGLHPGKTADDIIAPTLRHLLESATIGKVGVNVLKADFARLSRFFGLDPKGAIESSHLHRLVKFGACKPELVSVKLVSLAHQVEDQLGLPLYKGEVRTSNWSKPLSKDQINYAAGDAYAGFMLYHCMNAKRLAMRPTPPLPIYAELYHKGKASKDDPILLDAGDGTSITSEQFFGVKPAKSTSTEGKAKVQKKVQVTKSRALDEPLDHTSQALYEELVLRRATLAEKTKFAASQIISDALLGAIARDRPVDTESLLSIKGIGKVQQKKYGDAWLEVVSLFLATNGLEQPATTIKNVPSKSCAISPGPSTAQPPSTPRRGRIQGRTAQRTSPDSSPAFGTPPPRTPQLHTGLSFAMVETRLDAEGNDSDDDSLPLLDFDSASRRTSSQLKRKWTESPTREGAQTAPQGLQQPTQSDDKLSGLPATAANKAKSGPMQRSPPTQCNTEPLSPRSKISRNKLKAFSKLVTRKLPTRPVNAPPIVTDRTLDLIIKTSPQSQDALERIPGIDSFLLACYQTDTDLLRNVIKFAPARS